MVGNDLGLRMLQHAIGSVQGEMASTIGDYQLVGGIDLLLKSLHESKRTNCGGSPCPAEVTILHEGSRCTDPRPPNYSFIMRPRISCFTLCASLCLIAPVCQAQIS